jgi:hypothetical protein
MLRYLHVWMHARYGAHVASVAQLPYLLLQPGVSGACVTHIRQPPLGLDMPVSHTVAEQYE